MNEEKNLQDLASVISSKTNQNPALIRSFLVHLFKKIKKDLLNSSNITIAGLGTFKIIKSTQANRVLFISDLASDRKPVTASLPNADLSNSAENKRSLIKETKISNDSEKKAFEDVYKEYNEEASSIEQGTDISNADLNVENKDKQEILSTVSQPELNFEETAVEDAESLGDVNPLYEDLKNNISSINTAKSVNSIVDDSDALGISVKDSESDDSKIEGVQDDINTFVDLSDNNDKNTDQVYDLLEEYKDLESKEPRRSSTMKVIGLLIVFIFIIFALFYFMYPKKKHDALSSPIGFFQSYALLEDVDTTLYIASVIAETDLDFTSLSKEFYGCEIFWPYIYKANEFELLSEADGVKTANPLEIKRGTIIYIPKVDGNIIDKNNKSCVDSATVIAKAIMDLRIKR